jgi:hypothetical protein
MNKVYDFITRNEKWLYFIFLAICFLHFWATRYVPSLDGPQHLYNAQVLAELLQGNDLFKTFFRVNPVIVGYWSGHFFLTLFKLFLPGWLAEKFFLMSYVVAAVYSFRYLVKGLFPERQNLLVFLIFPFIFHSYLLLGYYSFSIAAIFYFWAFGYWVRHYDNFGWGEMFLFGLLSLAIFLSHGLVFVFFAFSFLLYFIAISIGSLLAQGGKEQFLAIFSRAWRVALSLIPAVVLCILYYISVMKIQSGIREAAYSNRELVDFIFRIRQLVGFHHAMESPAFRVLFVLIAILCISVAWDFFRKIFQKQIHWTDLLNLRYSWIFIVLFFLVAYFFMPDRISAGSLTNRFGLYFFLALIIFLSAQKVPKWLQLLTVAVLAGVMLQTLRVQYSFLNRLTAEMMEIRELTPYIEDGTTMASLNTSDNWIQVHFQLYAAIDKEVVHLDNPQCRGQFPVIWNQKDLPECYTGSERYWPSGAPDVSGLGHRSLQVDYITVFYYNRFLESDDYEEWKNILGNYYTLVKVSSHQRAALFKHVETADMGSP